MSGWADSESGISGRLLDFVLENRCERIRIARNAVKRKHPAENPIIDLTALVGVTNRQPFLANSTHLRLRKTRHAFFLG